MNPEAAAEIKRAISESPQMPVDPEPFSETKTTPFDYPKNWTEYCDLVRDAHSRLEKRDGGLILDGLELIALVGQLSAFVTAHGYSVFKEDDRAIELLERSAGIIVAATGFQETLGFSSLRAISQEGGLQINPPAWLSSDQKFNDQLREDPPGGHFQNYEHRMLSWANSMLQRVSNLAYLIRNAVTQGVDIGMVTEVFRLMTIVEHMLVVNGFTIEDAVILSVDRIRHIEAHIGSENPGV